METLEQNKSRVFKFLGILIVILVVYVGVEILSELKKVSLLGESTTPTTISFAGHGEVQAVPDIANVYFIIDKKASTAKAAQDAVAVVEKSSLDFLKTSKVDSKDIKTENASVNPTYEYQNAVCPTPSLMPLNGQTSVAYCPPGKQVQTGYEATESITVKIRNTDSVGAIMQGLGSLGVSNLSGPNFAIDKEDTLKTQARKLAIADAKAKAEVLAKDLGVTLGKISSFNESGNNYPIMYAQSAMVDKATPTAAPAVLPAGQNTISSDVTITYEIK